MKPDLLVFWRKSRWLALHRVGWLGALGVALAAAAVALAVATQRLEQERSQLLQRHVAFLDASVRVSAGTPGSAQRDPRDALWEALPSDARRGATVAQLLKLLESAKVEVSGAQYRMEDAGAGLRRLRVTVPVSGAYGGVRSLVVNVLNGLPNAALDGFELDREPDGGLLTGQLRLSLFFRKGAA